MNIKVNNHSSKNIGYESLVEIIIIIISSTGRSIQTN